MFTIAHATPIAARVSARESVVSRSRVSFTATKRRVPGRGAVAARASSEVWESMSGYMKNKCKDAAKLEATDKEAGKAAWIEIDREVPGARIAFLETTVNNVVIADSLDKFCKGKDDAEECKVYEA